SRPRRRVVHPRRDASRRPARRAPAAGLRLRGVATLDRLRRRPRCLRDSRGRQGNRRAGARRERRGHRPARARLPRRASLPGQDPPRPASDRQRERHVAPPARRGARAALPGRAAALAAIALAGWAAVAAAQQAHINLRDDVYACGGAVDLGADVRGDLVAAGGRIHVGNVQQDVIVAGGKVEIDGDVGDDVRVAGGEVTIAHHVGDHVVAAGGTLHFLPGSHVAGDIIVRGGKVILDGVVDGAVDAGGGDVTLNGTVGGGVRATAKELHVGDHAVIGGNLQYATRGEPDIRAGATIKGLRRRIAEPVSWRAQEHFGRSFRRLLRIFAILRVVAVAVGALV